MCDGLIPLNDLQDIMTECFPGKRPVFIGTMANSAAYATVATFKRAVTSVGSPWLIPQDKAVWWMEQSSYMAGPMRVRDIIGQRQLMSQNSLMPGGLRAVTDCGSEGMFPKKAS